MLGATAFNIVITVLSCVLLSIVCAKFIIPYTPEGLRGWFFPMIFIASIAISFIAYRFATRFLMKKIDMERYFEPIFFNKDKKD